MSRELEDLKAPIVELDAAIDGLSLVADSQGMRGSNMQDCLNFVADILREIHSNLEEKYEALEVAEQGDAPVPLRIV
jgi:hypothetical protein